MKWITATDLPVIAESHPARGAWIEIAALSAPPIRTPSHPARGAWIEIDALL